MSVVRFWVATPTIISFAAVCATFYGIHYANKTNRRMQDDRLRTEEHRQNFEMLRSKGEELCALIHTYFAEFRNLTSTIAGRLYQSGISGFAEGVDINENNARLLRIKMLVGMYFPECQATLSDVDTCHRRIPDVYTILIGSLRSKHIDRKADELVKASLVLAEVCERLQREIIAAMHGLHAGVVRVPNG